MPIDPAQPLAMTPEARVAERLAALERDLAALRRGGLAAAVGDGPPATDPTTLREGTPYIDRTNRRAYWVVAGVWRYAALT